MHLALSDGLDHGVSVTASGTRFCMESTTAQGGRTRRSLDTGVVGHQKGAGDGSRQETADE